MPKDERIDCSDERTVRMLYEQLGRPALGKTMNLVGQNGPAEEIVQDVFVKLWQKRPVFDSIKAAYAWVYKSCTNKAIDYLRSKGSKNIALEETQVEEETTPSPEVNVIASQTWLKLLEKLSDQEAQVFVYKNIEGLSQDEMAGVMKVSRRTINRIVEKLNTKLSRWKEERHAG